jgi:ADP-heptose:LPS heptosyltransferase
LTSVDAHNSNYVVARSVLPEKGLFDNWLFYPSGNLSKSKTAVALLKLFARIRLKKFDCLFYLMTRNRSDDRIRRDEKFFRAAGIKQIFGTDYLARNNLPLNPPPPVPEVESELEFLLDSLPSGKFRFDLKSKPELMLTGKEKSFSLEWLKANCLAALTENRIVAVAPGSKWESKIWAEERYEKVVSELIERHNLFPVIFGGGEDREKGNRLLQRWKTGANAAGELNIRQAAAALEKCRLYLGNDTGTMHLAASVGTPCVAVFAAIDYAGRWHPFGNNNIILREKVECEGCHLEICPVENLCLSKISVEDVFAACEKILIEN